MNPNDDVLKKLDENYQLIPMKDITDEARALAVRWCENYRPMGSINLEQKHKLASDIMNYAKHYAESLPSKEEGYVNGLKELLRMAGCPELLIENPNMLKGQVEAVDHEWALKAIEKYKDRPYIDNAERQ